MSNFNAEEHPYIQQVLARAARDVAFRARLMQSPHAAIKEETGVEVPPDFAIRFVQRPGSNDVTVLFPETPSETGSTPLDEDPADDELSLDDLEAAAGGTGGGTSGDDPESPW